MTPKFVFVSCGSHQNPLKLPFAEVASVELVAKSVKVVKRQKKENSI